MTCFPIGALYLRAAEDAPCLKPKTIFNNIAALACGLWLLAFSVNASSQSSIDSAIVQAQKILEDKQHDAYSMLGRTPKSYSKVDLERLEHEADEDMFASLSQFPQTTPEDVERIKARLSENRKALAGARLPTKYEDQITYRTVQIIVNQIVKGVDEFQTAHPNIPSPLPNMRQIVIGTVPGDFPNSSTMTVNPDEKDKSRRVYLVVIDSGLLKFAEEFSKIVVNLGSPTEPHGNLLGLDFNRDAVRTRLDTNPVIVRELQNLITAYLLRGGTYLALDLPDGPTKEPNRTLAAMMNRWILLFAVAHELGHVAYDQNDIYKTDNKDMPIGWSEEYSADGWGVILSLMTMGRNTSPDVAILGSRLFFAYYDVLERGISLITTGQDVFRAVTNHPPAYRRKEKITRYALTTFRSFWGQEPASITDFNQLVQPSQPIESAIDALWDRAKPGLLELHTSNAQLAQSWKKLTPAQAR